MIYFVTICVANRRPVLANEAAFKAFNVAVGKLDKWKVFAAMLMPDHLHVIAAPINNRDTRVGKLFRRAKTPDASGAKCIMELAAGVFRSSSAF